MPKNSKERKMRKSAFFIFTYACVGIMILMQIILMVWLEFVKA